MKMTLLFVKSEAPDPLHIYLIDFVVIGKFDTQKMCASSNNMFWWGICTAGQYWEYHVGAIHLSQVPGNQIKIGYLHMKSTGTQSSNELNNKNERGTTIVAHTGHQVVYPI